jgi:hypothetical protein
VTVQSEKSNAGHILLYGKEIITSSRSTPTFKDVIPHTVIHIKFKDTISQKHDVAVVRSIITLHP